MIWRVRSRRIFAELRARGVRVRRGPIGMTFVPLATERPQVAFAIGRRFGNAVERNRARRRLQAAFRRVCCAAESSEDLPMAGAFLLTANRSVLTAEFSLVVGSVEACLAELASRSAEQ